MLRVASAAAVAAAKAKALHTLPPSERVVRLCVSLHDVCNGDIIGSGPTLYHKVIPADFVNFFPPWSAVRPLHRQHVAVCAFFLVATGGFAP